MKNQMYVPTKEMETLLEILDSVGLSEEDKDSLVEEYGQRAVASNAFLEQLLKAIDSCRITESTIQEEVQRLRQIAEVSKQRQAFLRRVVMAHMDEAGCHRMNVAYFCVRQQTSNRLSAVVDDVDAIPDEYMRIKKVPNVTLIGEVLRSGVSLPFAHLGEPNRWLVIS